MDKNGQVTAAPTGLFPFFGISSLILSSSFEFFFFAETESWNFFTFVADGVFMLDRLDILYENYSVINCERGNFTYLFPLIYGDLLNIVYIFEW